MFSNRAAKEMEIACLLAVLIVVSRVTDAFVVTSGPHYKQTEEATKNLSNYAGSYYALQDLLLSLYKGDLADTCRSQLAQQPWFGTIRILLKNMMIHNVGQIETIDKNWYNESQKCGVDNTCIKKTNETWANKLAALENSAKDKIYQIQQAHLAQIKSYMDTCTKSNNCCCHPCL